MRLPWIDCNVRNSTSESFSLSDSATGSELTITSLILQALSKLNCIWSHSVTLYVTALLQNTIFIFLSVSLMYSSEKEFASSEKKSTSK